MSHGWHFNSLNRPSDRVRKKIKKCVGVFRHIMWKNTLIMRKTGWIMWKFKQFRTFILCLSNNLLLCKLLTEEPSSSLSL